MSFQQRFERVLLTGFKYMFVLLVVIVFTTIRGLRTGFLTMAEKQGRSRLATTSTGAVHIGECMEYQRHSLNLILFL